MNSIGVLCVQIMQHQAEVAVTVKKNDLTNPVEQPLNAESTSYCPTRLVKEGQILKGKKK